ncbi:3-deoxy-7-phosphoheptulonate synthase [Streptomyces sp900105755]|uniref:Phospho-2-dehydro-3-deoxyheptonate aldolase n=1 Tax=Streptomyces sp. 900105755 TaxID=3154389 RepID=A0ABV1TM82_9ACTN
MGQALTEIQRAKALQQPDWPDLAQVQRVREILGSRPPLVRVEDVHTLRSLLASVAAGEALVVQAGDCAEDPEECTPGHVRRKTAVLDLLGTTLKMLTGKPVVRVGRMAGQFAKPRSNDFEQIGDLTLPVYRGHMVNSPEPDPEGRRPDPLRILTGYMAAGDIVEHLGWRAPALRTWPGIEPLVWTSHEALLLDYEVPMIRELGDSTRWLGSTHWPWIGERTRQLDGAHLDLLSDVVNPVACKVGPTMTTDEITSLCERLDPLREPGRLTLISRMGADVVGERLPSLVAAVRSAGHPVIWLCDPMHGNTITAPGGRKTRLLSTMAHEVQVFGHAVAAAGGVAGGLHLETTPDDVTECAADASTLDRIGERHTTFCDPRLNSRQAVSLVAAWATTL